MNDSLFSTKDMVKYLIVGGLVYAILKMIPSVQLANKDLMLLLAIITVGFVCLDCLFLKQTKTEGFANEDPFALDLETDVNELIRQRQESRKDSRQDTRESRRDNAQDAEREDILARLEEKRRKTSDPVEVTKTEIKKLDTQIENAFSGAEADRAKKAKAELEIKLEKLKSQELTAEQEVKLDEKRAVLEEKRVAEEEHIDAIKASRDTENKIAELKERRINAISRGSTKEATDIQEEIEVTTKAKEVADKRVELVEKRRELIKKKLNNIPVSEVEERRLAFEESEVAQKRVSVADEIKAIVQQRGITSELKQITQEQKDAIGAKFDAEDRLARVEERRAKRVVIDEDIRLPEDETDGSRTLPKTSCGLEVEKIRKQMEDEMAELREQLKAKSEIPPSGAKIANKYFESLMNDLADKGILDDGEIDNIQAKLRSKLLSMDEVIARLETLKKEGKSKVRVQDGKVKHDREYSELPSDFYTPIGNQVPTDWTSEYTILNTNKWQVPMPRPPVCINTQPCKVCPSDSSNYPVNLKQWDDSRYVTGGSINKKWADDQNSA